MAIYVETKSKLNFNVSNSANLVKIKVDCYNGTVASVNGNHPNSDAIHCGEVQELGVASDIGDGTIRFNCAANNPGGEAIKIKHTIYEEGGESLTYIFPDDYTGTPDFDENDEHVDYKFYINFI
jgi:hypothetical protein